MKDSSIYVSINSKVLNLVSTAKQEKQQGAYSMRVDDTAFQSGRELLVAGCSNTHPPRGTEAGGRKDLLSLPLYNLHLSSQPHQSFLKSSGIILRQAILDNHRGLLDQVFRLFE